MAKDKNTQKPEKVGFFKSVKTESKRVTWYPRSATTKNTLWLIAILVVLGAVVSLVDVGLAKLITALVSLGN
ncbi:MAG: preprotein translocase subunit SecE [Clostridia bacterium]|nr:preprotein translocase subunit SecE [Clostridia bacterium]MBR6768778.1 preprotein translocase subunit SecE [Clostridia bacterium]